MTNKFHVKASYESPVFRDDLLVLHDRQHPDPYSNRMKIAYKKKIVCVSESDSSDLTELSSDED